MDYKELEKYIKKLFRDNFNKYQLPLEDKQDVIQEIMIKIFKKVEDGTLIGDVENNKNYIFISVKNQVYYQLGKIIKRLPHFQLNEHLDVPNNDKNIIESIDISYKKELVYKLMNDDTFTLLDRRIVDYIFQGYKIEEIKIMEKDNTTPTGIKNAYANLKLKLKWRIDLALNPKYKYIIKLNDGRIYYFKSQKDICSFLNMSQSLFSYWKAKKRTIFRNFTIEYLS